MGQGKANKSELLSQLAIAKSPPSRAGLSPQLTAGVAVASMLFGALLVYLLIGGETEPPTVGVDAQLSPPLAAARESDIAPTVTPAVGNSAGAGEPILNASGYITARLVATVSAEIMGRITTVNVEEGMEVGEGQVLARLDDSAARVGLELTKANVRVQQARLQSIEADLDEARRVLQRVSSLGSDNYSSEAEMTRARANLDKSLSALATTKADIEVARLQVAQQQEHYDNHTIRAPFAGVVTVKNAQPGEIVSPSSAGGGFTRTGICTIVDMQSLEIEVDVNEAFIRRVYPAQKVVANLDAYPKWDIPASVIAIIPSADRAKATVRVRIKIEVNDARILPDMGVKVAFLK